MSPSYYSPDQVGKLYSPNTSAAVAAGESAGWTPASGDEKRGKRIALFTIDAQVDFVHTDGALSVPGSIEDIKRLIELIYREGYRITTIVPTIDTHYPFMIFFPTWWRNQQGEMPTPFTIISEEDVKKGTWRAVIEPAWSHSYVGKLAKTGKQALMIWPFHCMDTSPGICLVPPLYEAIMYHAAARHTQPIVVHKGHIPQTEFYSPLRPEVDVPHVPGGTINTPILNVLAGHEEIWVAGEAKSHCVLEAMKTLTEYFGPTQPEVLKKILFLMDCTSSVVHPAVDFEAIAQDQLQKMAKDHGIQLVRSTDLFS